jgi:hypothetical protein
MVLLRHLPKLARLLQVLSFCAMAQCLTACDDLAVFVAQPRTIKTSEGFQSVDIGEDGYFHLTWDAIEKDATRSGNYNLYLLKTAELPASLKAAPSSPQLSNNLLDITTISLEDSLSLSDQGVLLSNLKDLASYKHQEKIDPKIYYIFSIRSKSSRVSAPGRMVSVKVNFKAPGQTRSSWNRDGASLSWDYVAGASSYDIYDANDQAQVLFTSRTLSTAVSFAEAAQPKDYCVRSRRGELSSDECTPIAGVGKGWKVRIAEITSAQAAQNFYRSGDTIEVNVRFTNPVTLSPGSVVTLPLYMGTLATATYVGGSGSDTLTFQYTVQASDVSSGFIPVHELAINTPTGLIDSLGQAVDVGVYRFNYENMRDVKIDADPPTVNLGADRVATGPIQLTAATQGAVKYKWTQISGPGTAQFSQADKPETEFSATVDGIYLIRLSVEDDSGLTAEDDLQVHWDITAPIVNVGTDRSLNSSTLIDASTSGASSYQWTMISGPGSVTFGSVNAEDTTVSGSVEGDYVLRLTVMDAAGHVSFDEMTLTWDITPPVVNAGLDRLEGAPFILTGSGSGATTWAWSIVSSPGIPANVNLSAPHALSTNFDSSDDGSHVLRLTATDAAGNSASDDVTVVYNAKPPVFAGVNSIVVTNSQTEVHLAWPTAIDAVTNPSRIVYDICQTTVPSGCDSLFTASYTTAPGRLSYTIHGLSAGTRYEFNVRARDEIGNRSTNNVVKSKAPFSGAVSLSLSSNSSCSLMADATVQCWGSNTLGQLGDGTLISRAVPKPVAGLTNVTALASGWDHSCALINDGSVHCWGSNSSRQLADSSISLSSIPIQIPGLSGVTSIAASRYQTCAVTNAPAVYCWGYNVNGVLGDGTTTTRSVPTLVTVVTGVNSIAMGRAHTCAL